MDKKKTKEEIKKDVGIVIKPLEQVYWESIIEKAENAMKTLKDELTLNEAIIEISNQKIKAITTTNI